MDYIYEMKKL